MSGNKTLLKRHLARRPRSVRALNLETLERREVFAAGDLDLSFGGTGIVKINGNGTADANEVRQVGSALYSGNSAGLIAKMNLAGTLDLTYGNGGSSQIEYKDWTVDSSGRAMLLQEGGGFVATDGFDVRVERLNANGTAVDGAFPAVTLDFKSDYNSSPVKVDDFPVDIQMDSSGQTWVLTVGDGDNGVFPHFAKGIGLARLTDAGVLDTTFSGNGKMVIEISSATPWISFDVRGMTISGNSAYILAVQENLQDITTTAFLYKVNSSGVLDTSFSGDGIVELGAINSGTPMKVAVDANGGVFVGQYTTSGSTHSLQVSKFNTAGGPDTGFNTTGTVTTAYTTTLPTPPEFGLATQADGKLLVSYGNNSWNLARYLTNGTLDPDFGTGGTVTTPLGTTATVQKAPQNILVMTTGQILVSGREGNATPLTQVLTRYAAAESSVSSSVTALPASTFTNSITVSWSGTATGGATITGYDVFYRIGAGSYIPWQVNTTATSATLGENVLNTFNINSARRKTISFYSVAHDSGGGTELAPATPDTSTDYVGAPRQNPLNKDDVDGDGNITIDDILFVIAEFQNRVYSAQGEGLVIIPPVNYVNGPYGDIDGNNRVNVDDILLAINNFIVRNGGSGESPASGAAPAITPLAAPATAPAFAETITSSTTVVSSDPPDVGTGPNDLALLALFSTLDEDEA